MHHSFEEILTERHGTQSFVSYTVCVCTCICAEHTRWLISGHTVSQMLNSNSFFHSFEAVCVYAAQGHWFVPDSRLLFTTLSQGGPNPISKFPLSSSSLQGENHLFSFFPSLLLSPADASQESKAAKAAIKMHLSPLNSAGTRTGAYRYCVLASHSWKQIAEQAASLLCVLKTH